MQTCVVIIALFALHHKSRDHQSSTYIYNSYKAQFSPISGPKSIICGLQSHKHTETEQHINNQEHHPLHTNSSMHTTIQNYSAFNLNSAWPSSVAPFNCQLPSYKRNPYICLVVRMLWMAMEVGRICDFISCRHVSIVQRNLYAVERMYCHL